MPYNEKHLSLGIETSCDETSAAVVENGRKILSNVISSQIDLHKKYGGVVPEIASRKHVEIIIPVIEEGLNKVDITLDDIDSIGIAYGPGLVGALLVGLSTAKAIAYGKGIPFIGVNHLEGHIFSNFLEHKDLEPPFLTLIVSGGHTHLVYMKDYGDYEILGRTRDDAAGEAFDKTARVMSLGYPGGPNIDKLAKKGDKSSIKLPIAYLEKDSLDFSFSGSKTAVLNYINTCSQKGEKIPVEDVCASFQESIVKALVDKSKKAIKKTGSDKIVLAGGVSANSRLREAMVEEMSKLGVAVKYPKPILCTDNGAMIASACYYKYIRGERSELDLNAVANLSL